MPSANPSSAAFAGVLFMYRSGRLRATPQFTRAVMGAAIGYFILGLVSLIASFFGEVKRPGLQQDASCQAEYGV